MRIMLVNDDGIDAPGIQYLAEKLKREYEVFICAPEGERSASSHCVTYFHGDHLVHYRKMEGIRCAFAVEGTPADCVYYGLHSLLPEKPDLIISGINQGQNLSTDIIYSGTVGAASEGILQGIPSMAVSLCSYTSHDFSTAAAAVKKLIPLAAEDPHRYEYVLNVNVPSLPASEIRGFRITHLQGLIEYQNDIRQIPQEDGSIRLHINGQHGRPVIDRADKSGDITAVENGYISLSPLHHDLTEYAFIKQMHQYEGLQL